MNIFRGDVNQLLKGNGSHYIPQTCKSHYSSPTQKKPLCFSSFFSPGISLSGPFLLEISVKSLRMRAAFLASDFRLDGIGLLTADKRNTSYLKAETISEPLRGGINTFRLQLKLLCQERKENFVSSLLLVDSGTHLDADRGQINKHQKKQHISEPLESDHQQESPPI